MPIDPFSFFNHMMNQFGGRGNLNIDINNRSGNGGLINRNDGFIHHNPGNGEIFPLNQLITTILQGSLNRDPSNNGGLSN